MNAAAKQLSDSNPTLKIKVDAAKAILEARIARAGIMAELSRGLGGGGGRGGGIAGLLFGGAAGGSPLLGGIPGVGGIASALGGPASLAIAAAAAAAIGPAIAQGIGTALTAGLGAAITAMAAYGAMQSPKVRNVFATMTRDINTQLVQIGKPFIPVLDSIFRTASSVMKSMTPVFQGAAKIISGPIATFADTFLKAFRQPAVASSIEAVARAFGKILTAVSPQIAGDIKQVASAIGNIATAMGSSGPGIATFLRVTTNLVSWTLQGIGQLIHVANFFERNWASIWTTAAIIELKIVSKILDGLHSLAGGFLEGIANMIHWARVGADALGMHFLDGIDNGFRNAKGAVDRWFNSSHAALARWTEDLRKTPTEVKIRGDISNLQGRLMVARQLLTQTSNRKTQARIDGNITQLESAIATARFKLAALNGTTSTVYIQTISLARTGGPQPLHRASGGYASGLTLVGERGPELIQAPAGSYVYSNRQSRQMAGAGVHIQNLTITLPPGSDRQQGKRIVEYIRSFEQGSGSSWRK